MKVMTAWSLKPGAFHEAVQRFLAGQGAPGEGVTLLSRWYSVDHSCGFSLFEASDPMALFRSTARWADVMDMKTSVVVEDREAGPALAEMFGK